MKPEVQRIHKSIDAELAFHLQQAEDHLIAAANLFSRGKKPIRDGRYIKRLLRAQEATTSLYREELIRIRGPLRPPRRGKR